MTSHKIARVQRALREKIVGYITAAFGLVAGLAWNEAIKALIDYLFPFQSSSLIAKIFYALVMTLITVLCSLLVLRWHGQHDTKDSHEK